jgi:hypothetical protein
MITVEEFLWGAAGMILFIPSQNIAKPLLIVRLV